MINNLIIAYHGCDQKIAHDVVNLKYDLYDSTNDYDWLGNGIYFWENDPQRALEWAKKLQSVENPAVLGAIISPKRCLDLTTREDVDLVRGAYDLLTVKFAIENIEMPKNIHIGNKNEKYNNYYRKLDCAVINLLHESLFSNKPDVIRALFPEGEEIYENSGFLQKTHTQIAVRDKNSIIGYFLPKKIK